MSIPINELRIGNLVYMSGMVYPIKVPQNMNGAEWFEPIPLTPEWLDRLGFVLHEFRMVLEHENFIISWDDLTGLYLIQKPDILSSDAGICLENSIKSVHALQNLYHALTGTELILKP